MTESQNRDLWFALPPQRSLLVWWLFSAIPIHIVKFPIFIHLYLYGSAAFLILVSIRYRIQKTQPICGFSDNRSDYWHNTSNGLNIADNEA